MLLARPKSNDEECLVSYLIRVAESNGFKHVGHLLHYAGLGWKNNRAPIHKILSGEFDATSLLLTLGLSKHSASTAFISKTFRRVVDTHSILVSHPKICPECLEELGYCKYQWALLPVVACFKHKKMLIDVSPVLGKQLSWYRQHLNRFDDEDQRINPSLRDAEPWLIQQSHYFELLSSGRQAMKSIPVILQGLEFKEALSLIHFIAHFQMRLLGNSFTPSRMHNNELGQVYGQVWRVLRAWPDSFYELLSQFIDNPMSNKGLGGINKHFRDLYEQLHRQQENQGVARIKAEFDRYVERYWPGILNPSQFTRIQLDPTYRNIITKKHAASILGTRRERIDKFVLQDRLSVIVFKGKAHYKRDQVEALANVISSNWTMAEACEALELTRYQLKQLLNAGLISAYQRPDDFNRDWVIDKAQCLALVERLVKKGRRVDSPSDDVTMAGIQRQGYSIVQLVLAMLNGKIEFGIDVSINDAISFKRFERFKIVRC